MWLEFRRVLFRSEMTKAQALRIISSAAVNGDYIDDETLTVIESALTGTSDVTVPAPRGLTFDPDACPVIADGTPCELAYRHRGRHAALVDGTFTEL